MVGFSLSKLTFLLYILYIYDILPAMISPPISSFPLYRRNPRYSVMILRRIRWIDIQQVLCRYSVQFYYSHKVEKHHPHRMGVWKWKNTFSRSGGYWEVGTFSRNKIPSVEILGRCWWWRLVRRSADDRRPTLLPVLAGGGSGRPQTSLTRTSRRPSSLIPSRHMEDGEDKTDLGKTSPAYHWSLTLSLRQ